MFCVCTISFLPFSLSLCSCPTWSNSARAAFERIVESVQETGGAVTKISESVGKQKDVSRDVVDLISTLAQVTQDS